MHAIDAANARASKCLTIHYDPVPKDKWDTHRSNQRKNIGYRTGQIVCLCNTCQTKSAATNIEWKEHAKAALKVKYPFKLSRDA